MEQVARLPTRKELALRPLYVMIGSAGLVIAWFEIFWPHCHAAAREFSAAKETGAAGCRNSFYTPLNKFKLAETTSSIAFPAFRKS
jgi:hypothetical protein